MRVGRVTEVEEFPQARQPSYLLTIDFGPHGVKRSSAVIQRFYDRESLRGRLVVAVINFPPRQIANRRSEVQVLAAVQADGALQLLQPDGHVELGTRIR